MVDRLKSGNNALPENGARKQPYRNMGNMAKHAENKAKQGRGPS